MKEIKKVLCVCIGNSDRSPVMAAVLGMFLKNAGHDVICESAGISENARGGCASEFGITAAKRIGLDISKHVRRQTTSLELNDYDLIICASDEIARKVMEHGADMKKVYNAMVANPWPLHVQDQYDETFERILVAMSRVMKYYFPPKVS